MSMDRDTAREDQVCMTLARVKALWSLARSISVSRRCCFVLSLTIAPVETAATQADLKAVQKLRVDHAREK